jgi:1,4-alpha-glucan branching enzyme
VAFFRDPKSTLQVWSRDHGYPGDFAYLEFHKKHWPGGFKLWRITDGKRDLATKTFYDPAYALQKVRLHARHFAELVQGTLAREGADGPAVVCSPYDGELFGHWWFEGPAWLEQTAREMHRVGVLRMTMSEALEAVPPRLTLTLPEGSWGEGGDHRVWLNRETEWTWDRVYSAETEWVGLLNRLSTAGADARRVLAQVSRELLILEASDWQFLITTGAARDYAERRVAEHYVEFKRLSELADMLLRGEPMTPEGAVLLQRLEREDFCFPDLDATWGQPPPPRGSRASA